VGPSPAGPMSYALMFFESFRRRRLAHSSRKSLMGVISAGTARSFLQTSAESPD
jgi:hypothetical protein